MQISLCHVWHCLMNDSTSNWSYHVPIWLFADQNLLASIISDSCMHSFQWSWCVGIKYHPINPQVYKGSTTRPLQTMPNRTKRDLHWTTPICHQCVNPVGSLLSVDDLATSKHREIISSLLIKNRDILPLEVLNPKWSFWQNIIYKENKHVCLFQDNPATNKQECLTCCSRIPHCSF